MFFKNKTDYLIIEGFDGITYVNVPKELCYTEEIKEYSRILKSHQKKQYIPPWTNPWKHTSCLAYLNTIAQREGTAND